jgi:8-oxo-dGTP pyrophosphatase MutT (NUDIX family)
MSAQARNDRGSRLAVVRSTATAHQPSPRFVRLSQLHKVRPGEQVAAVCYRVRNGGIEFLLVRTRGGRRWIFPKGSAEPGLTRAQAAAMEAFEEAGVHGRIEEKSFARYICYKRGQARGSASRPGDQGLAVSAHLCEVRRLAKPTESNRKRTWFSIDDARQRLQEGREPEEGAEFARVVKQAVARIRRLRSAVHVAANRPRPAQQNDPLRKVQFEAVADTRGRLGDSAYYAGRAGETPQFPRPSTVARRREVLQAEILPFSSAQQPGLSDKWVPGPKKIKALGTGARSGSTVQS